MMVVENALPSAVPRGGSVLGSATSLTPPSSSGERSMCRVLSLVVFCASVSLASWGWAGGRPVLISHEEARRFGLERAWFTRVTVDSGSGHVAHVSQHVSSTNAYTVHRIEFDGGAISFSERDVDQYGDLLGPATALLRAERKLEELEAAELNPKLESHKVPAITLLASTDRGIVQSIDGETGRTLWVAEVGRPGQAIEIPGANDDFVGVVNRLGIYVLDARDGKHCVAA